MQPPHTIHLWFKELIKGFEKDLPKVWPESFFWQFVYDVSMMPANQKRPNRNTNPQIYLEMLIQSFVNIKGHNSDLFVKLFRKLLEANNPTQLYSYGSEVFVADQFISSDGKLSCVMESESKRTVAGEFILTVNSREVLVEVKARIPDKYKNDVSIVQYICGMLKTVLKQIKSEDNKMVLPVFDVTLAGAKAVYGEALEKEFVAMYETLSKDADIKLSRIFSIKVIAMVESNQGVGFINATTFPYDKASKNNCFSVDPVWL